VRGPLRRPESERCATNVILKDGTGARCQRRAVSNQQCKQHAKRGHTHLYRHDGRPEWQGESGSAICTVCSFRVTKALLRQAGITWTGEPAEDVRGVGGQPEIAS